MYPESTKLNTTMTLPRREQHSLFRRTLLPFSHNKTTANTIATPNPPPLSRTPPFVARVGTAAADPVVELTGTELPLPTVVVIVADDVASTDSDDTTDDAVPPPCTSSGVTVSSALPVVPPAPPSTTAHSATPLAYAHDSITVTDGLAYSNTTLCPFSMSVAVPVNAGGWVENVPVGLPGTSRYVVMLFAPTPTISALNGCGSKSGRTSDTLAHTAPRQHQRERDETRCLPRLANRKTTNDSLTGMVVLLKRLRKRKASFEVTYG